MSLAKKALRTISIPGRAFALYRKYSRTEHPASNRHMLVVPGFFDVIPEITWAMIKWALAASHGITIHIVKPPRQGRASLEESADLVIDRMFEVMNRCGVDRVSIAGHSWGAIVVREVMRRLEEEGNEDLIEYVLRLAPPDHGTLAATYGRLVPIIGQYLYLTSPSMRMMCYQNEKIMELARFSNGKVSEHVFVSKHDGIFCSPWTTGAAASGAIIHLATLNEADLRLVPPGAKQIPTVVGHLAILFDREIIRESVDVLAPANTAPFELAS